VLLMKLLSLLAVLEEEEGREGAPYGSMSRSLSLSLSDEWEVRDVD
jgi:hypothetical protein